MKFARNLSTSEILDQALHFRRIEAIDHCVFMGMGEPMLNIDNVLAACERLPDLGIGHRHTAISTVGWIPGIERLAEQDMPLRLALSLHAADDALRSIDEGAAAISVSNHGGRQLDGVPASLRALPEVVQAVKGRIEVLMDGGVRRGTDVAKAICMGARAVLCGRAYAYGLAAAGEAGVDRAIEILRVDLDRTLRLLGCPSVSTLDRSYVNVPKTWEVA